MLNNQKKQTGKVMIKSFSIVKTITEVCRFLEQKKTSKSNFSDGEIFFDA